MGRAIVVMVSTLLFGIFGLFVAWLNVQAVLSDPNFRRTELITMSYAFGPLLGCSLGFSLSLFAMWLFTPIRKVS
jgi:hypothetical protein